MIKKLHACCAAVLLCAATGLAGPATAATQHKAVHHKATHHTTALHKKSGAMSNEARLNAREHEITARLNRQALTNGEQADAGTIATADASLSDEDFAQQAFLDNDE
jgi:hypothetical protein